MSRRGPGTTAGGPKRRSTRKKTRPVPLSAVLGEYLEASGLETAIQRVALLDEWPEIVGGRIARVARATEVRGDALVVEVTSSAWLNELTMMRHDILERINRSNDRLPMGRILFRLAERSGSAGIGQDDPTN